MNYATPRYAVPHRSGSHIRGEIIREEYEHLRGFNIPRAEIARRLGITDASLRDILRRQDRRQESRP